MNNMEFTIAISPYFVFTACLLFFASGPRLYRARAGGREYFGACEYGHA